jgi:hypothetical protein
MWRLARHGGAAAGAIRNEPLLAGVGQVRACSYTGCSSTSHKGTVMTGTTSIRSLYTAAEESPTPAAQLTIILLPDTRSRELTKRPDAPKGIVAQLTDPSRRCPS